MLEICWSFAWRTKPWLEFSWSFASKQSSRLAGDLLQLQQELSKDFWQFAGVLLEISWRLAGVGWRFASKMRWEQLFLGLERFSPPFS